MAAPASHVPPREPSAARADAAPHSAADARDALARLRLATEQLSAGTLASLQRLAMLEQLRGQAMALLPGLRAHYIGQPQPLDEDERLAWEEQVALWHAFYFGYALCGDIADPAASATVWTRALDSLGRAIREHGRVYRAVPPMLWKELNSCYRTAEACEVNGLDVPSGDASTPSQNCKSVYLTTLLHDAAQMSSLSGAQMRIVEGWLAAWTRDADLLAEQPAQAERSPLAVDLDGASGAVLARELPAQGLLRHLDTTAIGTRLRGLAAALRENRDAPELAGALREVPRAGVERLLTHLYVQWCSAGSRRKEDRLANTIRAQAAVTMHAIHFQISGRSFRQPGTRYTREEEYDLATFGHITERTEHRLLTGRSAALEPWEIVNQGASGSLAMMRKPGLQSRISHGQLVAVRTSSAAPPLLGAVQRLLAESDGTLLAGIRIVSSEVRGVALRPAADPAVKFERALLLAADAAKGVPQSLIVPRGQYVVGMIVEMHDTRTEKVQLGEVLERGHDFERIACERL